jgi:hypothetical protein
VDAFEHRSDQELLERTGHEPEAFGAFTADTSQPCSCSSGEGPVTRSSP